MIGWLQRGPGVRRPRVPSGLLEPRPLCRSDISSGVCPRNAECGSTRLCSWCAASTTIAGRVASPGLLLGENRCLTDLLPSGEAEEARWRRSVRRRGRSWCRRSASGIRTASADEKGRILDEFVALTGLSPEARDSGAQWSSPATPPSTTRRAAETVRRGRPSGAHRVLGGVGSHLWQAAQAAAPRPPPVAGTARTYAARPGGPRRSCSP